jgi:hypothetical protein
MKKLITMLSLVLCMQLSAADGGRDPRGAGREPVGRTLRAGA